MTPMVKVKFFGLIRSNHRVTELELNAGTIQDVINQIIERYPKMTEHEISNAVLIINKEKVMHLNRLSEVVQDGDEIAFTNFVGGG